tara:strand:+ start:1187 stop:1402 length:216 start_codon:yes stop_codon:yes gene_type:complete
MRRKLMSRMSELHYEIMQQPQEDSPEIEYHMIYPEKMKWTPRLDNWYNKYYAKKKTNKSQYVKAKKVRLPF